MAVQAPNKVMAWDTGRGGAALHLRGDGVVWRWRVDGVSAHLSPRGHAVAAMACWWDLHPSTPSTTRPWIH